MLTTNYGRSGEQRAQSESSSSPKIDFEKDEGKKDDGGGTANADNHDDGADIIKAQPPVTAFRPADSQETRATVLETTDPTQSALLTGSIAVSKPPATPPYAVPTPILDTTAIAFVVPESAVSPDHNETQHEEGSSRSLENGMTEQPSSVLQEKPHTPSLCESIQAYIEKCGGSRSTQAEDDTSSLYGEEPYPPTRRDRCLASLKRLLTRNERDVCTGGATTLESCPVRKDHSTKTQAAAAPSRAAPHSTTTDKPKIRALIPARFGSTFYVGLVAVTVLFVLHVILLCLTSWSSHYGITIFMSGTSCKSLRTARYLLILMVNIFAMTVGIFAHKALRCVLSPTRQDLNAAHELGEHMTVGVISFRNWARVGWPRKVIAVCLIWSSLPLSLL